MLEQSIAELTKAVLALTYALNQSRAAPVPVATAKHQVVAADVRKHRQDGESLKDTKERLEKDGVPNEKPTAQALVFADKVELPVLHATVEVPNEKPKTTTDTSPPSEPESKAVSYDDVKKATNALSAAKGRDATIAVLSRFGVKKATELDEAQWMSYIAHANNVVEGADV